MKCKICSWGASVEPKNRPAEQQPYWDRSGDQTDCQVEYEPSLLLLQTGKAKRSASKGNQTLVRLQLKYCVLRQAPHIEKEFENLERVTKMACSLDDDV